MDKNFLVLPASARKNGNSSALADEFIRGAREVGHKVEKIYLQDKKINDCLGCGACRKNGGICMQEDDMQELYKKMMEADVIVLVSPVYFYSFSARMKAVIDRTFALEKVLRNKTFYLLATGAAPSETYMTTMISGFRQFIGCLEGAKEGGIVFGYNTSEAGDIQGNPALEQAYLMGREA